MSQLIRFEDKYGMTDIVCIAQGLGTPNTDYEKLTCKTIKDNIVIQYGLTIGNVLGWDDLVKNAIIENNVEEITYVFDMDSIDGKGILTVDDIQGKIKTISKEIEKLDTPVAVNYAPIVWAAETIALYILLEVYAIEEDFKREKCTDITSLIHSKNTVKFHGRLLKDVLIHNGYDLTKIKTKHIRDFIDNRDLVINKLKQIIHYYPKGINRNVLQWIITGNTRYLYDSIGVIEHQKEVEKIYNQYKPKPNERMISYNQEIDLNRKCW